MEPDILSVAALEPEILEEFHMTCMHQILKKQVDATIEIYDKFMYQQNMEERVRAVVVYLPVDPEHIAFVYCKNLAWSNTASVLIPDVPSYVDRIPLPHYVQPYNHRFMSCTDLNPGRPVGDVVIELLIRTSDRCVYHADAVSVAAVSNPSAVGIWHAHQPSTPRNWLLPTDYMPTISMIEFPKFQGKCNPKPSVAVYEQASGLSKQVPLSFHMAASNVYQKLQGVKVTVEDYDNILTPISLIDGIIQSFIEDDLLSKMATSPLPWLLPNNMRIVMLQGLADENAMGSRTQLSSGSQSEHLIDPIMLSIPSEAYLSLVPATAALRLQEGAILPMSNSESPATAMTAIMPQEAANSPVSNFSSPATFMTASSPASFMTARSTYASPAFVEMTGMSPGIPCQTIHENEPMEVELSAPLKQLRDEYHAVLLQQEILQPFDKELNWSGKGQHVMFLPREIIPLDMLSNLGCSITAKVDKVRCRRIALARKSMRCNRNWTIADALREVYHLQNLRHFHIVQLVGSYLQGRNFSILMYPVADCHLGTFLEDTADSGGFAHKLFLARSLACLASAVGYVHDHTTKHMDIKPQNILVRETNQNEWRIYLADFGLSRSFASEGHSQTDGPTSRTPRYCAPEVFQYESRGRSADIFSLGCVFCEILTVCAGVHPQEFADSRRGDGNDESFHANLPRVLDCMEIWINASISDYLYELPHDLLSLITKMINSDPEQRPPAHNVIAALSKSWMVQGTPDCCKLPPEPYVVHEEKNSNSTSAPEETTGNG